MTPVRRSPCNKVKALYHANINRFYGRMSFIWNKMVTDSVTQQYAIRHPNSSRLL